MSRHEISPDPRIYSPFLKLMLMLREQRLAAIVGRLGADPEASNEDPTASGLSAPTRGTTLGPLLTMILAVSGTMDPGRSSSRRTAKEETSSPRDGRPQPIAMGARLCCRLVGH